MHYNSWNAPLCGLFFRVSFSSLSLMSALGTCRLVPSLCFVSFVCDLVSQRHWRRVKTLVCDVSIASETSVTISQSALFNLSVGGSRRKDMNSELNSVVRTEYLNENAMLIRWSSAADKSLQYDGHFVLRSVLLLSNIWWLARVSSNSGASGGCCGTTEWTPHHRPTTMLLPVIHGQPVRCVAVSPWLIVVAGV
jgi:hypothetical protein